MYAQFSSQCPKSGDFPVVVLCKGGGSDGKSVSCFASVQRKFRLAGFDRADYSLVPLLLCNSDKDAAYCSFAQQREKETAAAREEGEGTRGRERRAGHDGKEKEMDQMSQLTTCMLGNNALLALKSAKRESPYDITTRADVAEYLSHVAVWKHVVKYKLPYLLVVDGAKFATIFQDFYARARRLLRDVNSNLDEFDVLFLCATSAYYLSDSASTDGSRDGKKSTLVQRLRPQHDPVYSDTSAYIVSLRGAKKLLERALPVETRVAPYMFTIAHTDGDFVALLAREPVCSTSAAVMGEGATQRLENVVDRLALAFPRRSFVYVVGALMLFSVLLLVATIVFACKWRQEKKRKTTISTQKQKSRERKRKST